MIVRESSTEGIQTEDARTATTSACKKNGVQEQGLYLGEPWAVELEDMPGERPRPLAHGGGDMLA